MRQVVQSLKGGEIDVVELPDPIAEPGRLVVANRTSLISAGTESALSRVAAKSLLGKARERPADAKRVIEKLGSDGLRPTLDAVQARLHDWLTPGYSSMGTVVAVGADVSGFSPGERVACVGANHACHAELISMPAPLCVPLPDAVGDEAGCFGALGAIAAHGLRLAGVEAGSVVAVIGLGLVGQLASQLAAAAGARVVAIDPAAARAGLAVELGASASAPPDGEEAPTKTLELSDGAGADAVLIAAASADAGPIELAAELARDRAVVCAVGDVALDVPRAPFYEKELQLRVSRSYGPGRYDRDYEERGIDYPIGYVRWTERRLLGYFFDEIARGRIDLAPLITHRFAVERAADAYRALAEPERIAVLLTYPERKDGAAERRVTVGTASPPASGGRLRVALIGPGAFARSVLLPRIADLDVELAAIVGRSGPRAAAAAERFGASWIASDPEEVLADGTIGSVVIATRHDSHAHLTAAALAHGKAVLVEKPLAIDAEGLAAVEEQLASGGRLLVGFNRSVAPMTERVRSHFAGRSDPLSLSCRVNAGELAADHWLRDPDEGGGRLVGEACHFIDLASAIVGADLSTVQVSGLGTGPRTLPGDNFVLTLAYADGSVATIAYVSSGPGAMAKERIEVIGAGKAAVIDDFRGLRLHGAGAGRGRFRGPLPLSSQDKGHEALLAAAFEHFGGRSDAPIPLERILATTTATLLARDALAGGRREPLAVSRDPAATDSAGPGQPAAEPAEPAAG